MILHIIYYILTTFLTLHTLLWSVHNRSLRAVTSSHFWFPSLCIIRSFCQFNSSWTCLTSVKGKKKHNLLLKVHHTLKRRKKKKKWNYKALVSSKQAENNSNIARRVHWFPLWFPTGSIVQDFTVIMSAENTICVPVTEWLHLLLCFL